MINFAVDSQSFVIIMWDMFNAKVYVVSLLGEWCASLGRLRADSSRVELPIHPSSNTQLRWRSVRHQRESFALKDGGASGCTSTDDQKGTNTFALKSSRHQQRTVMNLDDIRVDTVVHEAVRDIPAGGHRR